MTAPAWFATAATAATVLTVAGLAKAARPADTARALRAGGLPARDWVVRTGSGLEAAIGLAALIAGGRLAAALVAVSYCGLAGFVAVALLRDTPLSSCGCFGEPDTPPTILHVVINVFLSVAAWMAFAHPVDGLPTAIAADPAQGLVLAALIALATYAVVTALTALPKLSAIGVSR